MSQKELNGSDVGATLNPGRRAGVPEDVATYRMAQELVGAFFANRINGGDAKAASCERVEMPSSSDRGEISIEGMHLSPVGGEAGHEPVGDRDGADAVTLADESDPGGAVRELEGGLPQNRDLGTSKAERCETVNDQGIAVLERAGVGRMPGEKDAKAAWRDAVENPVGSLWRTGGRTMLRH